MYNAQKVKTHPQVTEINYTNTENITLPTAEANTENISETIKGETILAPTTSAVEELPSGYPNVPEWLREIRASLPSVVEKPVAWCLRKSNIPVLSELQQAQLEQNAKQQEQQVQQAHEIVNDVSSAQANEQPSLNHMDNDVDNKNYVDVDDVNHVAEETSAMVPAALFVPILSLTILIIAKCIIARQNHENALLLESAADYEDEDVDNLDTSNNIYMTSLDDKVGSNNINQDNTDNNNSTSIIKNTNTISAGGRNGAKIPPTESMVTLTEDNTFIDSTNANVMNANTITGGNVMNDYLQAHVSETTQGINNNHNNSNKENNAVVQVQQEEQQSEDKQRQISEGENVSEGIVNTANKLNNNKMILTESLAVEVNNTSDHSILVNDDENTLTEELPQTNNNVSNVANRSSNNSSSTTTTRRSHRLAPVERVKSPSPETSASASASGVDNIIEHVIPRPMTSRFALKGEVVAALVGNPSINEVNVLLVAATRYECARVFVSQNVHALPNIINTPVWLNVQFVNNVIDTISETALLHGLRRVGVFAQPVQNTPHGVNSELIPLPRFRHPANALYVFIAHTTLPQGQRNDAMSEYDKLANTVLASTESHVFSGPAHGEAGIPVNECFYDRLQKERQAERVNMAAATATNA